MENLVPLINNLQDLFTRSGYSAMELPCIAVIGSQSSGKSSVLESIIGEDFLPRGTGIVTKRPLIIQCYYHRSETYGSFLHMGDRKYVNMLDIQREIVAETEREIKKHNIGISSVPIHLKFYSPHTVDLTLIDLPGMTRYTLQNQHENIGEEIKNMILKFIQPENCLILAVSSANTDLANSDALALSKIVDPEGVRTIGVLTKLDLMDEGTDASDILLNKVVKLRHGWIGVINRSQRDLERKLSMRESKEKELEFYRKNAAYRCFGTEIGVDYLKSQLSIKLIEHIKKTIPSLTASLRDEQERLAEELRSLEPFKSSIMDLKSLRNDSPKTAVLNNLQGFITEFIAVLEGQSDNVSFSKLFGSARISYIFHKVFPDNLDVLLQDDRYISDNDIRTVIKNTLGLRTGLFVSDVAFQVILKRYLSLLKNPSVQCLDMVYQEIQDFIAVVAERQFPQFPNFSRFIVGGCNSLLRELFPSAKDVVEMLVDMQTTYINTYHPDMDVNTEIARVYDEFQKKDKTLKVVTCGYIQKQGGPFNTFSEKYFVVTADRWCCCYVSEDQFKSSDPQTKIRFHLGRTKVTTKGPNVISISSTDGEPLYKGSNEIVLKFRSAEEASMWLPTFSSYNAESESIGETERRNSRAEFMKYFDSKLKNVDKSIPERIKTDETDDGERIGIYITRHLLVKYFEIVKKIIQDTVPKAIMTILVVRFKKEFGPYLLRSVLDIEEGSTSGTSFETLISEDPAIAQQKKKITDRMLLIDGVLQALKKVDIPREALRSDKFTGAKVDSLNKRMSSVGISSANTSSTSIDTDSFSEKVRLQRPLPPKPPKPVSPRQ